MQSMFRPPYPSTLNPADETCSRARPAPLSFRSPRCLIHGGPDARRQHRPQRGNGEPVSAPASRIVRLETFYLFYVAALPPGGCCRSGGPATLPRSLHAAQSVQVLLLRASLCANCRMLYLGACLRPAVWPFDLHRTSGSPAERCLRSGLQQRRVRAQEFCLYGVPTECGRRAGRAAPGSAALAGARRLSCCRRRCVSQRTTASIMMLWIMACCIGPCTCTEADACRSVRLHVCAGKVADRRQPARELLRGSMSQQRVGQRLLPRLARVPGPRTTTSRASASPPPACSPPVARREALATKPHRSGTKGTCRRW
jgi:hypothetical protein